MLKVCSFFQHTISILFYLEIKPTIIRDLEAAINATKGLPMTLTIEATGNPKPTVRFFRGADELIAAEGQIELKEAEDGQTFTATILSMQPNQQGEYTATVQNTGGMAKSKKCKVAVSSKYFIFFFISRKTKSSII
jgi:hypothetical protein